MKKNNLFIAICLCISTLCITACTVSNTEKGGFRDSEKWGKVVTKPIDLPPFSHIYLLGNVDIKFTQGDVLSVEAYGNEKAIEANEINVNGDVLTVSRKEGIKGNVPNIKLIITAPSIESVDVAGAGDIDFKGDTELKGNLDLHVSGAGDVGIDKLKCNNLNINISGAGDVTARKITSENTKLQICGAGDIDAKVKATDIYVIISGAGDANLDVNCNNLIVTAGGTGDVELKGECVNLTKSSGGMAGIDSRKLTVKNNMNIK